MTPHSVIKDDISRLENEVEIMKKKEDTLLGEAELLRVSTSAKPDFCP